MRQQALTDSAMLALHRAMSLTDLTASLSLSRPITPEATASTVITWLVEATAAAAAAVTAEDAVGTAADGGKQP